jgi:hypothetical protein
VLGGRVRLLATGVGRWFDVHARSVAGTGGVAQGEALRGEAVIPPQAKSTAPQSAAARCPMRGAGG